MKPERVAVVGAGPAGLAAAWELQGAGVRVTLYEERGGPGGRMRSDAMDGASVDVAVQLLSSTYTHLLAMARKAGVAERVVRAPGRDALWRKGRPHAITYGSIASMITSSALPTGLKLRLAAKYLPFLGTEARGLDANDPGGTGGAAHDTRSIGAWGAEHLGEDFVELLAYPLLAAYYGGVPEETSAAMYHALARVGLDVQVLAVRGGMGSLALALTESMRAKGVEFRSGAAVTSVHVGDGVQVSVNGHVDAFDAAVLAVPAPLLHGMLALPAPMSAWLDDVITVPTLTLALLLERPVAADFFGLSFPRLSSPGEALVALCVQSRKTAGLVPEGREALVAFPNPTGARDLMDLSAEHVVERLMPSIEQVFPGVGRTVVHARVHRFTEGYTLFRPGYLRHLRARDPSWLPDEIALAGDYLVAPTVEGAVISGRRAASGLLQQSTRADRG